MTAHSDQHDWLQATVIRRAAELGMTAGAISDATHGKVSRQHVHAYLTKQASMGSHKLQHVLLALGLGLMHMPASGENPTE